MIAKLVYATYEESGTEEGLYNLLEQYERRNILQPCRDMLQQVLSGYNTKVYTDFGRIMYLLTDINHPLVLKYGFDPADFMLGARQIFENIWKAQRSKEFREYCIR